MSNPYLGDSANSTPKPAGSNPMGGSAEQSGEGKKPEGGKMGCGCAIVGILLLALMGACLGDDSEDTSETPATVTATTTERETLTQTPTEEPETEDPSPTLATDTATEEAEAGSNNSFGYGEDDDSGYPQPAPFVQQPAPDSAPAPAAPSAYYANCGQARAAGAAPLYAGSPGYGTHLDRDGDGVACE